MTLVMSFPQTVSLARVFGAILLLSFITFLSEEGRRLKRMGKYIFRNIGAILVIIIMLATLVMGIYMLVTATIPTGGKWLLSIIFFLNAIVIGRALVT
jgi:cobalamin biosynthesis protein CobD/CbiB